MSMNQQKTPPGTSFTPESVLPTMPDVKAMMGRVWAVAELLAGAIQQETSVSRSSLVSEKTQH